ncbi:CHAT domain-containing protein [Pseudomaricurvus alcaniphilus]|nr:CHAT domain-containing protein [Pseudomaricurvus alcaniphilus]
MLLTHTTISAAANNHQQADALLNQGLDALQQGHYQQGLDLLHTALPLFQRSGNHQRQCIVLQNIGITYLRLDQPAAAAQSLQQALSCADTLSAEGKRYLLLKLGEASRDAADFAAATRAFRQLHAAALDSAHPEDELIALFQLGKTARQQGLWSEAGANWQAMLDRARAVNNLSAQGSALFNLGDLYSDTGAHLDAINAFQDAIQLARKVRARAQEAVAHCKIGAAYYGLHAYPQALDYFNRCQQLVGSGGHYIDALQALNGAGSALYQMGELPQAAAKYSAAASLASRHQDQLRRTRARSNLALVLAQQGKLQQAAELIRQDLATEPAAQTDFHSRAWLNLGTVLERQQQYRDAVAAYRKAISFAEGANYRRGIVLGRVHLGRLQVQQSDYAAAIDILQPTLSQLEAELEQADADDLLLSGVLDAQQDAYLLLQFALTEQRRYGEALAVSERGRARAFARLLQRRQLMPNDRPKDSAELAQQLRQRGTVALVYTLLPAQLLPPVSGQQQAGGAALIWVIDARGQLHFRKVLLPEAAFDLVSDARLYIGVSARSAAPQAGDDRAFEAEQQRDPIAHLSRLLIEPIAESLPATNDANLLIVPHGPLYLLPFALLGADRPLLQSYNLYYAPSLTVALQSRPDRTTTDKALVVGNPLMPSPSLNPLPGAEQEAREIARLLGVRPLLGAAADESAVRRRLGTAAIVHLATHGVLGTLAGAPPGSAPGMLALAPGSDHDGWLTPGEIVDIPLAAELVVLSACDTAQGRLGGDGVQGLSRAFLAAGARHLLASLWKVPDAHTRELMVAFYRHYLAGHEPAAALRQAQLALQAKYQDPYYWAAFIALGTLPAQPHKQPQPQQEVPP